MKHFKILSGLFASVLIFACDVQTDHRFLTDPFLQLPTSDSVNVVWFTNFKGINHTLTYGKGRRVKKVKARTMEMTKMMEDASSTQMDMTYTELTKRPVYRHEATARGLVQGKKVEYSVTSIDEAGSTITSDTFTLAPAPAKGTGLKILLTSDLQSKVNAPANYQRVVETIGVPDAVFFAGDFVNCPDRASEWFDQIKDNAPAFFPTLQGRYQEYKPEFPYNGAAILQHAPLFGTIGNHEVMGRYRPEDTVIRGGSEITYSISEGFNDPQPRWMAEILYEQVKTKVNPRGRRSIKEQWITDHSHNHKSFIDVFSFPDDGPSGEDYYAVSFGDVFLISMNVSRIWRSWNVTDTTRGKFTEMAGELTTPDNWGLGEFLFERFDRESVQYKWLKKIMKSRAFKKAKYRVVMAHQSIFGLGDNSVPVLADPVMQLVEKDPDSGAEKITELNYPVSKATWESTVKPKLDTITEIRYQYPVEQDDWFTDIEPLLVANNVNLVHVGHSHLWNRAKVGSVNYLETSNVGNSYGAYYLDPTGIYTNDQRGSSYSSFWNDVYSDNPRWDIADYAPYGDPQGRDMEFPSIFSPMSWENENYPDLPFVATNNLSVFSVLDTADGVVRSYVFDPSDTNGEVKLFDEFSL